jgi:hypothetical protein
MLETAVNVAVGHHGDRWIYTPSIALIYGIVQWSRRPRAAESVSGEATRRLYRKGDPEKEPDLDARPPAR